VEEVELIQRTQRRQLAGQLVRSKIELDDMAGVAVAGYAEPCAFGAFRVEGDGAGRRASAVAPLRVVGPACAVRAIEQRDQVRALGSGDRSASCVERRCEGKTAQGKPIAAGGRNETTKHVGSCSDRRWRGSGPKPRAAIEPNISTWGASPRYVETDPARIH